MLDILILNPKAFDNISIIKTDRCQIKSIVGFGNWPPIGHMEIGAILQKDYSVKVYDAEVESKNKSEMILNVLKIKPKILILQSTTPTIYKDIETISLLKEKGLKAKVIIWGLHPTVRPKDYLKQGLIDFVIKGEPELTVKETVDYLMDRNKRNSIDKNNKDSDQRNSLGNSHRLKKIKGIVYKYNSNVIENPERELITNLDSLPFPAKNLVSNEKYIIPSTGKKFTIIKTSRGCPYKCTFCTTTLYYRNKWRTRSADNIFNEIIECVNEYKIRDFMFLSDTFNVNNQIIEELCNLIIESNLKINWVSNSRADLVKNQKTLDLMKKAGCWLLSIGIESGSQKILDQANKRCTLKHYYEAIRIINKSKIKSLGYFMFGLPGESKKTIEETYKFIKKSSLDYAHFYHATPFPGTEFHKILTQSNWLSSYDWADYLHGEKCLVKYPDLSANDLDNAIKRAYFVFYFLSPKRIIKEIFSVDTVKNFVPKIKTFFNLMNHIKKHEDPIN